VTATGPRLLREQPGEGDLRGRGGLAGRDGAEQADERLVGLAGLGLEAGMVVRMSLLVNVVSWVIVPVRKPLPSGL
jgi:hypothetical protein